MTELALQAVRSTWPQKQRQTLRHWGCLLLLVAGLQATAWGRGGGGCLEQGTPILTPDGAIPIEQLAAGDTVLTWHDGRTQRATVAARIQVHPSEYLELRVDDRTIRVTPEHPFQIALGVFRIASSLHPGDWLYEWDDHKLTPRRLTSVNRIAANQPAYNLLVTPGGTYFANKVLVHNKGCFLADTPIRYADGTQHPISQVQPSDRLIAFAPDESIVIAQVNGILTAEVDEYRIVTTPSIVLKVTPEHPFYVGEGTFKTLEALKEGDFIYVYDGLRLHAEPISGIEIVRARSLVYNLQTDAPHTYFANGAAVHNKGGGGFSGGHGFGGGGGFRGGGGFGGSGIVYGRSPGGNVAWNATTKRATLIAAMIGAVMGGLGRMLVRGGRPSLADFVRGFVVGSIGAPILMWLAFASVQFAFFLLFGLLAAVCSGTGTKDAEDLDFTYSRAAIARKANKTQKLLTFISKVDGTFAPERLGEAAQSTFLKLQQCWQARDYAPMEALLMRDLYSAHCEEIAGLIRNHEINRIDHLHVERVDIVNVRYPHKESDREFTALITARARDYYVDDRNDQFLRGDDEPAGFQEFWTFQRQSNVWLLREIEQSRESDVLKDENFFEPFTEDGVQQVYAETAGQEGPAGPWLEKETETKAGRIERLLNFLVTTDKLWNRREMLERARQIFLNIFMAQEKGDAAAVKEVFPEVAAHLKQEIGSRRVSGTTIEYRNLCVRKAELILIRNFADNAKDEFTTRISAHAQQIIKRNGLLISQDDYVTPFTQYWTFGRLDGEWKLKEVLPEARGQKMITAENVDEESSPDQLQWYYKQKRAG